MVDADLDVFQGLDSSDIKLDFTFDAELAKLSEGSADLSVHKELAEPSPSATAAGVGITQAQTPASVAASLTSAHDTNDLGLKIASAKKVWDQFDDE